MSDGGEAGLVKCDQTTSKCLFCDGCLGSSDQATSRGRRDSAPQGPASVPKDTNGPKLHGCGTERGLISGVRGG